MGGALCAGGAVFAGGGGVSAGEVFAVGFSRWKRGPLRLCLAGRRVRFVAGWEAVPAGAMVVVWGMGAVPEGWAGAVLRVEDGFLRSVGLGAELVRPLSWVVDGRGMYFDASRPSDLEVVLMETAFSSALLARARALRAAIVAGGVTKYNVGRGRWQRPAGVGRVILVPGQVESDASLVYGAPGVCTNAELLAAVRAGNPGAFVVYKPHPDVVAGLRAAGSVVQGADAVVTDVAMGALLSAVDEVHCMTSLAGFEALLRGKRVVCYGQPFYAGWGLTCDVVPVVRRSRRLTLDELVAGALIVFPRYMNRAGTALVSPEAALAELVAWRGRPAWWRWGGEGLWRAVLRCVVGVR